MLPASAGFTGTRGSNFCAPSIRTSTLSIQHRFYDSQHYLNGKKKKKKAEGWVVPVSLIGTVIGSQRQETMCLTRMRAFGACVCVPASSRSLQRLGARRWGTCAPGVRRKPF